jgi:UDP-glucose 6-dehydrogenase
MMHMLQFAYVAWPGVGNQGGPSGGVERVVSAYEEVAARTGKQWAYVRTTWENAEALKLVTNSAMAVKITFANEAAILCNKLGADWDEVSRLLALDPRLGSVGFQVPGPDGKLGFGGACLPKDLSGLIAQANTAGTPIGLAEAAQRQNVHIRKCVAAWRELVDNLFAAEGKP